MFLPSRVCFRAVVLRTNRAADSISKHRLTCVHSGAIKALESEPVSLAVSTASHMSEKSLAFRPCGRDLAEFFKSTV
jgi:hypothetical protein